MIEKKFASPPPLKSKVGGGAGSNGRRGKFSPRVKHGLKREWALLQTFFYRSSKTFVPRHRDGNSRYTLTYKKKLLLR